MIPAWPRAWGNPVGSAFVRSFPEDFRVTEELEFELSGEGEHRFLFLEKRKLNSMELVQRVSALSGVPQRDIGLCGLKDRNAVTRQWISVGMAGRAEPDWQLLERDGDVTVVSIERHARKLRRGVHRANRFTLVLRGLSGSHGSRETDTARALLEQRLRQLRGAGVPNYFGEQRFGRDGATLEQALRWMRNEHAGRDGRGGRKVTREKRSLYFSAMRAYVFNRLLAQRVRDGVWNVVLPGDVCMLHGTRSFFTCEGVSEDIAQRNHACDIHPGLPLWGRAPVGKRPAFSGSQADVLADCREVCEFLEASGLELAWRPARLMPDDFCWQFCDDGALQLEFSLGAGGYATALLAEFVQYKEGCIESGISG